MVFLKKGVFISFIWFSIFSSACKIESLNDPIIISLVDKEFSLELWENLQSTANPLEFHFQTIADENCLNTSIESSYTKENLQLNLTIFNILAPETCETGMAPAMGAEAIDGVVENGFYSLEIELQGVVNNIGTLQVSDDFYKVDMDQEIGINWAHDKLLRVPQFALWGYITYQGSEQLSIANNFVASLDGISSAFEGEDGYYGHFTLENTNLVAVQKAPADLNAKIFILSYSGHINAIDPYVDDFTNTAPEGMELHIFDGRGNEW